MKKLVTMFATCLLAAQVSAAELGEQDNSATETEVAAQQVEAASNEVVQADIDEQNNLSDSSTKDITPQSLDDFFEEFKEQHGIEYSVSKNGRTFFTSHETVTFSESDPDFGKSLNLAFDKVMLKLQAEFVRDNFGDIANSTYVREFTDGSTNNRQFADLPPAGRMAQVVNKIVNLAGAELDSKLAEYGIEVDEGISEERKKELVVKNFVNKTRTKANSNMQGLIPVQTAITKEEGGSYYKIGVIAVMSDKTRQVAIDMRQKRASLIKGKGRNLKDILPAKNEGFLSEHGIRLVYNEKGDPVIISYGQWSYRTTSNARSNEFAKDAAFDQARARADAAVADFINRNIQLNETRETGEKYEETISQIIKNGSVEIEEPKEVLEIIEIANQEITARSSMKLRGLGTLKRWSAKDANGIPYVGVVRYYSHDNVLNAERMVAPVKPSAAQPKPAAAGKSVSTKSRVVNDMDDF